MKIKKIINEIRGHIHIDIQKKSSFLPSDIKAKILVVQSLSGTEKLVALFNSTPMLVDANGEKIRNLIVSQN